MKLHRQLLQRKVIMGGHVVLIGDSIFDNGGYVPGGPSVLEHLRRSLPSGWQASLLAVDGATVSAAFNQVARIPDSATHLILSVGGNDALWTSGNLLYEPSITVRDALNKLGEISREFSYAYRKLIDELRSLRKPLTLCTVYDHVPGLGDSERAGLCIFNDVITRTAFDIGVPLIDLRNLCNEPNDYASMSPIEPSAAGGGKIARAIADVVLDTGTPRKVYAR